MNNTLNNVYAWVALVFALVLSIAGSGCSADCGWNAKTQAYVDENRNGTWDEGEPPLAGVRFDVVDARGNGGYGGEWESDRSGNAYIAFFVSCNRSTEFVLSATPPEGFVAITPERVEAGSKSDQTFTFSFAEAK